ncbi:B12-binding domain-containing radical SAM protein [Dorea sp. ICN-14282]|uniref:B12-binding domain-containing radical SAM protein n=1 Tax=Dorea sp. ICN-14282 TaxID=3134654 RepID=UPI0030C133AB
MKILLAAVNAKYIHSNLAIYSLKAYADVEEVELAEYTINQQKDEILRDLYLRKPDVLCFSCYIWNMEYVETLVREIAKLCPHLPIWLGGPEVSYDAAAVLERLPAVKGVMKGEGEETFAQLCRIYQKDWNDWEEADCKLLKIDGITFRREPTQGDLDGAEEATEKIIENPWRPVMDLSCIPFVYKDMEKFRNKIIYYESSRGCPFSCSYCLSSVDKRLRFRDLELVKRELQFFIDQEVPQVKFVDRTFNCRHEHALAIWQYIKEHDRGITNFHFEIAADLLNEEELELLGNMRPGLVQLEIGIQSTNPDTICAIRRTMDFEKVKGVVERIKSGGNIHQHLDLIAGLPYEDIESFSRSFDEVYRLRPEQLQLGFLKVLKGSYMEEKQSDYGLVHKSDPPYEVLYTKWLSYEDVILLKGVEEMVEVYYNSGQFTDTLEALAEEFPSAFAMYEDLWHFYEMNGLLGVQHKRSSRYEILLSFIRKVLLEKVEIYRERLTYDYYLRENAKTRPSFAGEYPVEKEVLRAFYESEEKEHRYLPAYTSYDRNQMRKMTHIEYFAEEDRYILFDYLERSPLDHRARTCEVSGLFLAKKTQRV